MSYTPPGATAANFSFQGGSAYTPPGSTAADFSFAPTDVSVIVTGMAAAGSLQAWIGQSFGLASAASALGFPGAVADQRFGARITGQSASGTPQAALQQAIGLLIAGTACAGMPKLLISQAALVSKGDGALNAMQAMAHFGYLTRVQGDAAAGTPQGLAHFGYFAWPQAPGALADTQATAFALPAVEDAIPGDVTYYFCKLTGAADGLTDAVLPISNFSVRHRYDGPSYYQITIPSYAYVTAITARPNGEIVLWSETGGVSEELLRGDLGSVRTDRGPRSQSISISGNSDRAASDSKTFLLAEALYASTTFEGESRLRIPPRAGIRPGDFVRYSDLNFQVGEVVWSVAVSPGGMAITMEIVNLPVDAT